MQPSNLFRAADGHWVTNRDLLRHLQDVGAPECDLLFVHSEMSFGAPNPDLGRRGLLEALIEVLRATGVRTIAMPAFTFSFCNGTSYDRQRSKSQMGALNEYFRALPDSERSADPLMSVVVSGSDSGIIRDLPHTSLGRGSTFDRLHHIGARVRFLFLGVSPAKCFTYTHYVEKCLDVPYRYDREITGTVVADGAEHDETWTLFVRYGGVQPTTSMKFIDLMRSEGVMREVACGNSVISCIAEPAGYAAIETRLQQDIDYFLETPYPREQRDRRFHPNNMVAL